jgi:vancomycin resistance protein YoaR
MRYLTLFFLFILTNSAHAQLPAPAPAMGNNHTSQPSSSKKSPEPKSNTQGISVGGVDITGLNEKAALTKLKQQLSPLLKRKVSLNDGNQIFWRTRAELGASIPFSQLLQSALWLKSHGGGNVPVRFNVDLKKATLEMQKWATKTERKPSRPSLDVVKGKVVRSGGAGFDLAVQGSAWRVKKALEKQPPELFVKLVSRQIPGPGGANLSPFKYVIGEYATRYNPHVRGRTVNLKKSAENIDGTIVPNGGTFSANKAIGERNAKNGWKEAKMFINGDVVDGIGSGICQCATTLYNAALLAGLPIVERHQHQFRVYYAPASRDATLYWGSKDFKFRNDTGGPIYVQTFLRNRHYVVRLYGSSPMTKNVKVESKVLSRRNGGERSEAFRIIDGKRELLSRDSYLPEPKTEH